MLCFSSLSLSHFYLIIYSLRILKELSFIVCVLLKKKLFVYSNFLSIFGLSMQTKTKPNQANKQTTLNWFYSHIWTYYYLAVVAATITTKLIIVSIK